MESRYGVAPSMTSPPPTGPSSSGVPPADDAPPVPAQPYTGGRIGTVLAGGLVLLVLALLVVTVLGRNVRAPGVVLTALVTGLPYLYAATAAVVFAAWAAIPDRRMPPILLGILALTAGVLWGPALASWPEAAAGQDVRIVSWNVRRLWGGPDDDGAPVRCIVDTLTEANADVLSLQEVSRHDADLLARELDLTCVHTDYLGHGDPVDGGLAVCVRKDSPWKLHSGHGARFIDDHPWHYVFVEVAQGDRIFNVLGVHLQPYRLATGGLGRASTTAERQGDQSAELLRRVGKFRDPTILAGDFNSTRDAALHVALRDPLTDAYETGGRGFGPTLHLMDWLPLRIDYVYVTDTFAVQDAQVVTRDCSDHRAVITDLVLKAAPEG